MAQASAWWGASMVFVQLSRVWRQKDSAFVACLNRTRRGEMSPADVLFLNEHCATSAPPLSQPSSAPTSSQPLIRPSRPMLLAPFNSVVNTRNSREMEEMKRGKQVLQAWGADGTWEGREGRRRN